MTSVKGKIDHPAESSSLSQSEQTLEIQNVGGMLGRAIAWVSSTHTDVIHKVTQCLSSSTRVQVFGATLTSVVLGAAVFAVRRQHDAGTIPQHDAGTIPMDNFELWRNDTISSFRD